MYLESFLNIKQFGTKYLIHFTFPCPLGCTSHQVSLEPYVPTGGLYSLGKVVSWVVVKAYLSTSMFFTQFLLLVPSLETLRKLIFVNKSIY